MEKNGLTHRDYSEIKNILQKKVGISLGDNKHAMVQARLLNRLKHYGLTSFGEYIKILYSSKTELSEFVNRLSTNESYFFRELKHFEFLEALCAQNNRLNVWSAAASYGAEAYSAAMILDSYLGSNGWSVVGSDINTDVLKVASSALYPLSFLPKIPHNYRKKYCLKGNGDFEGSFLIDPNISKKVSFFRYNLIDEGVEVGRFDVIFLRNVLLYFDETVKLKAIRNVIKNLKYGGYLIIGMTDVFDDSGIRELEYMGSSIYKKIRIGV